MSVLTLGVNYKTAPINIRERLAFAADQVGWALQHLRDSLGVKEAALLSTCNRTEFYCRGTSPQALVNWWQQYHALEHEQISPYLYQHYDHDAVAHMMRVASGLDSLVLGEPEIFGQMKQAYTLAETVGVLGKPLDRLFQHTFSAAKQVRTQTAIGAHPVSVAFAAVNLAKHIFSDIAKAQVLLVGAGQTIELVAKHLHAQGVRHMRVLNRTIARAEQLAACFQAKAGGLEQLPEALVDADIVISSTGSAHPLIVHAQMAQAMAQRKKRRPTFMVDLAVPRDVEPAVGDLEDVYLYSIDDLQGIVESNRQSRLGATEQAEQIIQGQADAYMQWFKGQRAMHIVTRYREGVADQTQRALAEAKSALAQGKNPQDVLESFAHELSNKWMHAPTVKMRQAAQEGDEQVLELLAQLFHPDE